MDFPWLFLPVFSSALSGEGLSDLMVVVFSTASRRIKTHTEIAMAYKCFVHTDETT